jgi:hypothetical protein
MALPGLKQYTSTALEASAQISTSSSNKATLLYQIIAGLDASGPASGYILIFDLASGAAAPANGTLPVVPPIKVTKGTFTYLSAASGDVPIATFLNGVRAYFQTGGNYQSGGSAGAFIQFQAFVE